MKEKTHYGSYSVYVIPCSEHCRSQQCECAFVDRRDAEEGIGSAADVSQRAETRLRQPSSDHVAGYRCRDLQEYAVSHVPGALHLPHIAISAATTAALPHDKLLVVYCWGPGCNGATKAAMQLSALGFAVKEMIGGIEYWEERERYPVERGT